MAGKSIINMSSYLWRRRLSQHLARVGVAQALDADGAFRNTAYKNLLLIQSRIVFFNSSRSDNNV